MARHETLSSGSVLRARTPAGDVHVLYLGTHPVYGDGVLVARGLARVDASVDDGRFSDGYVAFYPARDAVRQRLVEVVAQLAPRGLPSRLRRPGARRGREISTWILEDGDAETVRRELSDDERRLPIAAVWNHALLVQRVTEGWDPTAEGVAL